MKNIFENEKKDVIKGLVYRISDNLFTKKESFDNIIGYAKLCFKKNKIPFNSENLSKLFEEAMNCFNSTIDCQVEKIEKQEQFLINRKYKIMCRLEEQEQFLRKLKDSKLINEDDFRSISNFDEYR
jgi:Rad3-related DNA helicase